MSKRSKRKSQQQAITSSPEVSLNTSSTVSPTTQTNPVTSASPSIIISESKFIGPLPPPHILQSYDLIKKGFADRILTMAEKQASHRQELEKRLVKSDILKSYLGLGAGFVIAATAIICGALVAYHGQPWAGAAIGGAPVAALVWAFLKGTNDRQQKSDSRPPTSPA